MVPIRGGVRRNEIAILQGTQAGKCACKLSKSEGAGLEHVLQEVEDRTTRFAAIAVEAGGDDVAEGVVAAEGGGDGVVEDDGARGKAAQAVEARVVLATKHDGPQPVIGEEIGGGRQARRNCRMSIC